MFVIYGENTWIIKYHHDSIAQCEHCGSFELSFAISRDFVHFYYIPFCAVDEKEVNVLCLKCGEWNNKNPRKDHYKSITRTPIYLYTGVILIAAPIVIGIITAIIS
jgi:hypothetical protein